MHRTLVSVITLLALILTLPAATLAQESTSTPEGAEWHLTAYADGADLVAVPWSVDATLMLQDGTASGVNGCNGFNGSYELAGDSLTFDEGMTVTLRACIGEAADVEQGYMAALPLVSGWAIDDAGLKLTDADDAVVLEFQQPSVGLTPADIAAVKVLLADQGEAIAAVDQRVDNVRVRTLRERIKTLESQVKTLESQVKRLRSQASSSSSGSGTQGGAFSAAEQVLLEAIPGGIRNTCVPRRSDNPAGTVAAVQCKPPTAKVRDMAYYLMEGDDAWKVWNQRMRENRVKDGEGECRKGNPDQVVSTGGLEAAGCYRNADGRANLRYAVDATQCRQLQAGGTRLDQPALYIAVLGPDRDIAKLTKWAESRRYGGPEDLYQNIRRPKEAWSNACPT